MDAALMDGRNLELGGVTAVGKKHLWNTELQRIHFLKSSQSLLLGLY